MHELKARTERLQRALRAMDPDSASVAASLAGAMADLCRPSPARLGSYQPPG